MKIKEGDIVIVDDGSVGIVVSRLSRLSSKLLVRFPNRKPPWSDMDVVREKRCRTYTPAITVGVSGDKAIATAEHDKGNCTATAPLFDDKGGLINFGVAAAEAFIDVVKQKMLQECKAESHHIFRARDQYIDMQARLVEKLCKCYHSQVNEFVSDLICILRRLWGTDIDCKLGIFSYSGLREPRTPKDDLKDFILKWSQKILEEDDS